MSSRSATGSIAADSSAWLAFGFSLPRLAAFAQGRLPLWFWAPLAVAVLAVLPAAISRSLALRLWPIVGQVGWLEWYGQGLVISALATAGMMWATRPREATAERPEAESADPRDRLPPRLGRTVLCLQMEDHYVRVHTPNGSALVLMSLSQAMAGLKDVNGAQTHRSWWVAAEAVEAVRWRRGAGVVRLAGGLEAPVSRTYAPVLKDAGWF